MSRVPINAEGANNDGNNDNLRKKIFQVPQGISADLIASIEGFNRQKVDQFALESQRRAAQAQQAKYFKKSLFPVRDPETGEVVLERDEYPRANTTLEGLAQLEPAFARLGQQVV